MNIDFGIGSDQLPEDLLAQMEPGLTDNRPPSVAPSESSESDYESEGYAGDAWEELDNILQAQEDGFIEQDETAPTDVLFDAPATPIVKESSMPTTPTFSFERQYTIPSLVSNALLSPSVPPLKLPSRPLSPMRTVITSMKGEYQPHVSPPHSHVRLPSQAGSSAADRSVTTQLARESPSGRFFASPDQIDALAMPRSWIHGQVISTLGDAFCYTSRSKPRHERYEILPTNLLDLWDSFTKGHIPSRACLSSHFKQAISPLHCRAWLIPVLLEHHWYLLTFDWVEHAIRVCNSLATNEILHPRLKEFSESLLYFIVEDFDLEDQDWGVFPEDVSSFIIA